MREEAGKGGARALDLVLLELRTEQKHANERLEPFVEDGALAELGEALDELVERVKA